MESSLELDAEGLVTDELLYELNYRGIKGMEGKPQEELRCILRPLLKLERDNKSLTYPAYVVEPAQELDALDRKVLGLQLNVASSDTVDVPRAEQTKARVYHILNRLNRIPTDGLTAEQSAERSAMLAATLGQLDRLNTIVYSISTPSSFSASIYQYIILERADELRVARGLTVAQLFDSAIDLFEGKALLWFRSNRDVFRDWNSLSALLIKHYEPPDYRARLFEDILGRTQDPNESFIEYFSCMLSMFRRYGEMTAAMQLGILVRNLAPFYTMQLPKLTTKPAA
ncbi:Retrotransposon gag protein [Popillia japonica]|uniref:Retrotransposon gag protein n=1 Tax=Popillia japonica TaxID=7064 RepID=A0AAW1LAC3_POPJA